LTSYALSASQGLVKGLPGAVTLLLDTLEFGLLAAAAAGLFHYVPNTQVRWRHAIAGGLFVSAGIELAKKGLAWYLTSVPTIAIVYGAFATLPIFLIWIYLGWVIVLLGAVVAAYAPSLQMRVARWTDGPGATFHLALVLLRELDGARALPGRGLTAFQLSEALRIDPLQIEPVLETLVDIDWVGRLDQADNPRYVLLCDPHRTPAELLLAGALLVPAPGVKAFWQRAGFAQMTVADLIAEDRPVPEG
jgi:membrane protein